MAIKTLLKQSLPNHSIKSNLARYLADSDQSAGANTTRIGGHEIKPTLCCTYKSPNFVKMVDIFRVDDWAQTYVEHKWRGHIFCPDDQEIRKKISKSAKAVMESEFSIKFNDAAQRMCNIEG